MRNDNETLHACPLCGTDVSEASLGLRNYAWLRNVLPGRVGPTDVDFYLDQSKTGRALAIEFKPVGTGIGLGQRLTLRGLVHRGIDVWIVWGDGPVFVGALNKAGQIPFIQEMPTAKLAERVGEWWAEGYAE